MTAQALGTWAATTYAGACRHRQTVAADWLIFGAGHVNFRDASRSTKEAGSFRNAVFADQTLPKADIGPQVSSEQSTAGALWEIRRLSGLGWDELSELFGVSRPTFDRWVNRMPLSAQDELVVRKMLGAIRHLDEGRQHATRERLLATDKGASPFELLARRQFEDVAALPAGAGPRIPWRCRSALSKEEQAKRRPPHPLLLFDALQDRLETPVGNVRIAHPLRVRQILRED